jgi:hypothetical protein
MKARFGLPGAEERDKVMKQKNLVLARSVDDRDRIKIDAAIEIETVIEGRESLPRSTVDPNTFVEVDEGAYIEPGTLLETTLLGPEGKRMWRPPRRGRSAR